ncbi:hypothetical protein CCR94_18645 [Rhodoblastus sphagnicola]|uniref:Uncharacterized protein n=1 Tax=Rhodoblastus sphagnicola TaxID=333368 RepID=A0A2S6N0E8_9HYPH|nr:tetratricopeptide repeat protein [Rhodoblastus sphagnicola]MBB4198553.1 tetratricopeptide (TPR) repeat protein [Rhodoblastus sphagnicola]PPQ28069.1 hypothetical protein CCR94_18645 [Rhodoblastus sphagnicola]
MTKAVCFVAAALLFSGAARAEQPSPAVTDFSHGVGTHAMPTPPESSTAAPAGVTPPAAAPAASAPPPAPKQSAEALACANSDGKAAPQQRDDACSLLIDSHKWQGKEIAWAYANRCAVRVRLKQVDRALADCSEAIDQDPDQTMAYQLRAEIHRTRDERAKALEDFDKAIALGAKNAALFAGRGFVRLIDGDAAKALEDFDREVAIAGGAAEPWMDRGSAELGVGDDAKAEQDFAKAAELDPNNAQVWLNRGVAALGAGDSVRANAFFVEALKRDPNQTYAALWRFIARDGSPEAKAELQAYADKAGKDWPFAVTQFYLGRAEAGEIFGAAKSDDQQCEARYYVAHFQIMTGAAQDAAVGIKRAVDSCPKNFIEYFRAVADQKKLDAAK